MNHFLPARLLAAVVALATLEAVSATAPESKLYVTRLLDHPIISAATDASIGENIQGPSLIRVPAWVSEPLGRYYLYFADHKGAYIRLAYADDLLGPWTVHAPGSLQLEDSFFLTQPPSHPAFRRAPRKPSQRAIANWVSTPSSYRTTRWWT